MNRWIKVALTAASAVSIVAGGTAAASPPIPVGQNVAASPGVAGAPAVRAQPLDVQTPVTSEARFVPVAPCRAIDTRPNIGRLAAGSTYGFYLRGAVNFPGQGGKSGGCGIPAAATAVAVSVSSVNIGGTGYFRIWPYGMSDPGATIAHFQAGPISTTGGTVTLGSATAGSYDVTAEAFQSGAGLVVDVTGYYIVPIQAEINPQGEVYATTSPSRIVSTAHLAAGSYAVTLDRDVRGCAIAVTIAGGHYYSSAFVLPTDPATISVGTWGLSGGNPVDQDLFWYLTVTC